MLLWVEEMQVWKDKGIKFMNSRRQKNRLHFLHGKSFRRLESRFLEPDILRAIGPTKDGYY